jgi:hypothetical protein
MRIYATTRNGSTSKGIGDNKMILIDLNKGNTRIGTLRFIVQDNNDPYLDIELNGTWYEIALAR